MAGGIEPTEACRMAMARPLTDDDRLMETLDDLIADAF